MTHAPTAHPLAIVTYTDAVDTHWLTITNVGVGESMMETYSIPSSDAAVTILVMTSIYEIGLGRFDNTGSSFLGG